ncbi:MAG: flagellar hook-length control protein FliK [Defluviitaleaceae bacterium]|nr:flagellar hook-length control protein FliK [Defluviitaleaceae bacterium]
MKPLESLTAQGLNLASRNLFAAERANQGGFELVFAEAQRRESVRTADIIPIRNERRSPSEQQPSATEGQASAEQPRNTRRTEETRPAEKESVSATEEANQAYAQTEEAVPAEALDDGGIPLYIPDEQILAAVAVILQTPPEVLTEMLAQTELTPQDLTEPQNVVALMQEVYEAETPAALLSDPEFPAQYKAVNEAMAQLAESAKAVVHDTQQATDAKPASAAANAVTTNTPLPEGLQYAEKEGEIVVSDAPIEEEADTQAAKPAASSSNASVPAQAADTAVETSGPQLLPAEGAPLLPANEAPVDPAAANATPMESITETRVQSVQVIQQTQDAQAVNPADVINQIMSQIRVHTGEQVTEMRLTLRPESLGDIVLRVLTQNGIVTAQFIAESQRVREALESGFNQLRDALEEQGIQFSELSVSVRDNQDERMNQFARGRQNTRNRAESVESLEDANARIASIDFDGTIDLSA